MELLKRGWVKILVILGMIIYVVSPIDLVPDVLPLLGSFDDLALIAGLVYKLIHEYKKVKGIDAEKVGTERDTGKVDDKNNSDVIDGEIID